MATMPVSKNVHDILDRLGDAADKMVFAKNITVYPNAENKYPGYKKMEEYADLRNPRSARLLAGKQIQKNWLPKALWDQWTAQGKIVPLCELHVIGTREALARVVQLVYDSNGSLTVDGLKNNGGFNKTVNRNAGVHVGQTIGGDDEGDDENENEQEATP